MKEQREEEEVEARDERMESSAKAVQGCCRPFTLMSLAPPKRMASGMKIWLKGAYRYSSEKKRAAINTTPNPSANTAKAKVTATATEKSKQQKNTQSGTGKKR